MSNLLPLKNLKVQWLTNLRLKIPPIVFQAHLMRGRLVPSFPVVVMCGRGVSCRKLALMPMARPFLSWDNLLLQIEISAITLPRNLPMEAALIMLLLLLRNVPFL